MMRQMLRGVAVLVTALAVSSCDSNDPFEIPTSGTPPELVTDTFSGTVTVNGAQTHTFTTQASGTVTATLTGLAPDNTAVIGLALGTWNGTACQIVIAKDDATEASVVTGAVSSLGSLCVRVYDVGALTQRADYELQVIHP